jgi:hypothetical protein
VNGQSITGIANILIIILRSFLHLFMTLIDWIILLSSKLKLG